MVLKVIPVAKDTFSTNAISSSLVLTFATFSGYEVATKPFEPSDCGDKTDPKGNNFSNPPCFPALETITKPTLKTAEAAYYLGRSKQTLRCWACYENGPLRPIRVNGRLEWPLAQMKLLLGVV